MPEPLSPPEKHCSSRRQLPSNVRPAMGAPRPSCFHRRYDFSRNSTGTVPSRNDRSYPRGNAKRSSALFPTSRSSPRRRSIAGNGYLSAGSPETTETRAIPKNRPSKRERTEKRGQMFRPRANFSSPFVENERRYFIVPRAARSQTGPARLLSASRLFARE